MTNKLLVDGEVAAWVKHCIAQQQDFIISNYIPRTRGVLAMPSQWRDKIIEVACCLRKKQTTGTIKD